MGAAAASDPYIGTWKLDAAKSKFNPGPPPQSITLTITEDGSTVDEVMGNGQPVKYTIPMKSEAPAVLQGMPDTTVAQVRKGDIVEHTWKFGSNTAMGHATLSKDGKTMTYTLKGMGPNGEKLNNTEIYTKQ